MAVARWLGRSVRHCVKRCIRTAGVTGDSFSPLSLPNLALWLTPEYGLYQERTGASATTPAVADGDPVGTWVGRAAGGALVYLTAPNDAARPVLKLAVQNGRDVVRFDGVNDCLVFASSLPRPTTIAGVLRDRSASAGTYFDGSNGVGGGNTIRLFTDGSWTEVYSLAYLVSNGTVARTTPLSFCLGFGASGSFVFYNSVAQTIASQAAADAQSLVLGAFGSGGYSFKDVDFCELVVCSSLLSTTNRTIIESYLNSRWGVY